MRQRLGRLLTSASEAKITPLGDQAALVYCANEDDALSLADCVQGDPPDWLVDLVPAYASVAVFFDRDQMSYNGVAEWLLQGTKKKKHNQPVAGQCHVIPCCYDYHLDLDRVAQHTGLTAEEVIAHHVAAEYRVYAIGFCPGFPYLGYLTPPISGVPRLDAPRARVEAGSVGLTGRQTGIYTEARPGGWNIIGSTPLELVNVADGYFPLRTGDHVRFQRIDDAEFRRLQGERLLTSN